MLKSRYPQDIACIIWPMNPALDNLWPFTSANKIKSIHVLFKDADKINAISSSTNLQTDKY